MKYTNNKGKSIEFSKDFSLTFDEFKKQFENSHIFRDYPPKERDKELKAAFTIATGKSEQKKG